MATSAQISYSWFKFLAIPSIASYSYVSALLFIYLLLHAQFFITTTKTRYCISSPSQAYADHMQVYQYHVLSGYIEVYHILYGSCAQYSCRVTSVKNWHLQNDLLIATCWTNSHQNTAAVAVNSTASLGWKSIEMSEIICFFFLFLGLKFLNSIKAAIYSN